MFCYRRFSFLLLVLLLSCGKELPELKNIDRAAWSADKNGCNGYRAQTKAGLKEQLTALQGLTEMEIVELLGMPDQNELYKRNQKFFYYFLTAGPECKEPASDPLQLVIRFNAVGLAKEIVIE